VAAQVSGLRDLRRLRGLRGRALGLLQRLRAARRRAARHVRGGPAHGGPRRPGTLAGPAWARASSCSSRTS
jgi:hypothetical protein